MKDRWILGLTALGVVLRAAYALRYHVPADMGDQIGYLAAGRDFGAWWSSPDALRTPGYPLFIAAVHAVGLGIDGVRVLQGLAVSGACLLVALMATREFGLGAGRAAAAVGAVFPPLVTISGPILSDGLAAALFVAATFCLWQVHAGGRPVRWSAAAGAALAAAILVRPNLGVLLPIALLVAVAGGRHRARRSRTALAAVLALVVPILAMFAPWVARNNDRLGRPYPLGTNRVAFILGVSLPVDRASGRFGAFERDRHYFGTEKLANGVRTFAEVGADDPGRVLRQNITERPLRQLSTSAFWLRELWLWPADDRLVYGHQPIVAWPLLLGSHLIFLALAAAGLWLARSRRGTWLVAAAVVAVTAPFAVIQASPRYAIPAVMLLVVPVSVALVDLQRRVPLLGSGRAGSTPAGRAASGASLGRR